MKTKGFLMSSTTESAIASVYKRSFSSDTQHCKVTVRSDCPACVREWVIVSIMDSGHLEVGHGWDEGSEEAALV